MRNLALDFGLTDMSNRGGRSVADNNRQIRNPDFMPTWGSMPKGGVYKPGETPPPNGGAAQAVANMGIASGNALQATQQVLPMSPPKPLVVARYDGE